jgi:glutamine cyclotransferase
MPFYTNDHTWRKKVFLSPGDPAVFNLLCAACICFLISCDSPQDTITRYTFRVTAAYDHDPGASTQGLQYVDGLLYESTGLYGQSTLREVALESGDILRKLPLQEKYFGEGLTVFQEKVYQLTWKAGICFVYDRQTFDLIGQFSYETEGWGLTHDGTHLIMSDGSDTLYFRDPDTFEVVRNLSVTLQGIPLPMLNELEYIRGTIYANVWLTDTIALIDPESGSVEGVVDASGLLEAHADTDGANVLNGIAYDQDNDRLFVTGKLWPKLFEIELVEKRDGKITR